MATVTNQLTRMNNLDGALTSVSIGGGAGATANTDIFIQGTQSLARRSSNVTVGGFLLDNGAGGIDMSASGVHVGAWLWVTHYAVLTALRARIAGNDGSGNFGEHAVPLAEYPTLGGWIRVWVDLDRTADFTGGTGLQRTAVRYLGPTITIPSVGGNAQNLVLDAIDYGTLGLLLTGTAGVWQDFVTADEATANKYGVVESRSGIVFVRARLTLGSATSLVFSDSNFVLVFPQQALVSTTWMGVTCDLQNASTSITLASGSLQSPGSRKGDFVVTGTAGLLTVSACTLVGLRVATFTAACDISGSVFQSCGLVTQAGADIDGCRFVGATGAVALLSNDPAKVTDCVFTSGGTGHAIEFTTPGTYTFDGNLFSGYGADETTNAAVYNNSGGLITLNVGGGGGAPTVRNGTGASTVVVAGAVTVSVSVRDSTGAAVQDARVFIQAAAGGPFPFNASVTVSNSGTTATVTHTTHGLTSGDKVVIRGASLWQNNGVFTITVTTANAYTCVLPEAPGSSPTGTILATFVPLFGLTDVMGEISASRVYASAQPVSGRVRKSTASPRYRTGGIVGTVSNATGLQQTVQLVLDE